MNQKAMCEWVVYGNSGMSSLTMWGVLMGVITEEPPMKHPASLPSDTADFRRCYQMVEHGEVTSSELQRIKEVIPWYSPLIDRWEDLCALHELGNGIHRVCVVIEKDKAEYSKALFAMLQKIESEARKIVEGSR